MTPLLLRHEMQEMDRLAIQLIGIPAVVLMEVAGRAVAEVAHNLHQQHRGAVLVLAGSGNNGGDGVVAARHLIERGVRTTVIVVSEEERFSQDLKTQLAILTKLGIAPMSLTSSQDVGLVSGALDGHTVVVDGLFGTGLTRPIEGFVAEVIERMNASRRPIVSIDMPSGIDADTGQIMGAAVQAHTTVTFQFAKLGQTLFPGRAHTGILKVADIGIPRSLLGQVKPKIYRAEDSLLQRSCPPRRADAHKGSFGHLLVVAGTADRPGSALLAARAALRTGAGLVTVGSDDATVARLAPAFDELMGLSLGQTLDASAIVSALSVRDGLVIGPSLEPTPELELLVREVLEAAPLPVVLDAGALVACARDLSWLKDRRGPTILTPHPGEMARISGLEIATVQRDRAGVARRFAEKTGAYLVLKGASTVVASPSGDLWVTLAGNPGMATGGSGDVLAGIIGGLLVQGVEARLAAPAGAHLHGRAGDLSPMAGGAGMIASDILDAIPRALGL